MSDPRKLRSNETLDEEAPTQRQVDANGTVPLAPSMALPIAAEMATGAAAGALLGVLAGPPGIVVGALIGGAVGAAAGVVIEGERVENSEHDEQLDRDIGVSGGNLGAAGPNQPVGHGRYHLESLGFAGKADE